MAKSDRLLRLVHHLRLLRPPVTADALAQRLSVSLRTIYRDIEALRISGAQIEGEAGYGYSLREDPALPPQKFNRMEIEALMLGMAEVRLCGDPDMVDAAENVITKILATLPDSQQREALFAAQDVHRFTPRPPAPRSLGFIRKAIWHEHAIEMDYTDLKGTVTRRTIRPLSIMWLDRALMLLAWCSLRGDFRSFHCSAIQNPRLTGENFRPHRVALLQEYRAKLARCG